MLSLPLCVAIFQIPVPKKCMQVGRGTGSYSTYDRQLSGYYIIYTLPA